MRRALLLALLAAGTLGLSVEAGNRAPMATSRIVAVGDVHGASESFVEILKKAGLIDAQKQWIGGRAVLVQTGDVTDRGAGTRAALDLLMALEPQAAKAGGRVHALLGNHEVMNLTGEMRDATPEIFASFGGEAAMREAFSPTGHYGRWLRTKSMIASIDGTIFMHAGISPDEQSRSIDELNSRVRRDIEVWDDGVRFMQKRQLVPQAPAFRQVVETARTEIERLNALVGTDKLPQDAPVTARALLPLANIGASSLFSENGPLWYRGYAMWTEEEGGPQMAALLKKYRARRMVTGHTVQPNGRITERFGRSLFLIDTGMLAGSYFPSGAASALVIEGDLVTPLYLQPAKAAQRPR